ncbi:hypothetical protein HMPREF1544_08137 [Mucor circinelloides 1006PhL]|uniref:Multiple inositol polyphosphate phosphatase 1 n=1 Tax=Mucor circinelloides f. circinelloides (strain 1006PhL) TaxID=1220926 RepID=S2JZ34_MUCC1|nr:hypothetical protein HMPREF1544_08137 [Mucor circinelloides 1006PhL]
MRFTLSAVAALGLLSAQVLAKKNSTASASDNGFLDIDWIKQHLGARGGYPSDTVPQTDPIVKKYHVDQMQVIIRHGTRYPEDGDTEGINDALALLANSTNATLTGWVADYDNKFLPRRAGALDRNGQLEHYLHGKRLAKSYPDLIESVIDEDVVQFTAYSSWSNRTAQSGQAFCMGTFEGYGSLGKKNMLAVPQLSYTQNNDSLIAFHKSCPRWQEEVDDAGLVDVAIDPLKKAYMAPIAARLTKDLGVNITASDVKDLHSACGSEVTMHNNAKTFCLLFNKDDFLKLEYYDDLKHYYKYSYGIPDINTEMACDLAKTVMNNIELAVSNSTEDYPRLDLKFGHTETLLPFRTFLGLRKDNVTLQWNSTQQVIDNRKFKMSEFNFFANNIAFQVLSPKNSKNSTDKYVRVLDNEVAIVFPGCDNEVCPIDQFRKALNPLLTCDFNKLCAA